jgi:hypothetical protein
MRARRFPLVRFLPSQHAAFDLAYRVLLLQRVSAQGCLDLFQVVEDDRLLAAVGMRRRRKDEGRHPRRLTTGRTTEDRHDVCHVLMKLLVLFDGDAKGPGFRGIIRGTERRFAR